ncbi:MAG: STAS domain-containing protein [Phycisphaeraceae bacterium]
MLSQSSQIDNGYLVTVQGDIDFSKSPQLRQDLLAVLKNEPARLVIDLTGVSYMDSSGVATLVEALQHQRRTGNKLVLCALQPRVHSVFKIARLDTIFTITTDSAAALTA